MEARLELLYFGSQILLNWQILLASASDQSLRHLINCIGDNFKTSLDQSLGSAQGIRDCSLNFLQSGTDTCGKSRFLNHRYFGLGRMFFFVEMFRAGYPGCLKDLLLLLMKTPVMLRCLLEKLRCTLSFFFMSLFFYFFFKLLLDVLIASSRYFNWHRFSSKPHFDIQIFKILLFNLR